MYLKVLVMEIKEDYCLAMTEDGEVVRIQKKEGMKIGSRIYILREDLFNKEDNVQKISTKERKIISWKYMTAAAAVLAAVIGLMLFVRISSKPYAVVSVDGQRSIQLELDKRHTVRKAVSYDHSVSQKSLEKLAGRGLEEAGEMIKQTNAFQDTGQRIVSYGLYEDKDQETKELKEMLQEVLGNKDTVYIQGTAEDVKQAEKEKKTLGIFLLEKALKEDKKEAEKVSAEKQEEREEEEREEEEKEEEKQKKNEEREEMEEQKEGKEGDEEADEEADEEKEEVKPPFASVPSVQESTKPEERPETQETPEEKPEMEEAEEVEYEEPEQEEYEEPEQEESEETEDEE